MKSAIIRIAALLVAATTGLTIADFERLPTEAVERRELVDGELVDVSGSTAIHNLVRDYLLHLLITWVERGNGGTAILEQEYAFFADVHAPDVSFFGPEKRQHLDRVKRVQRFVADLAVEVASPNDTHFSLMRKKDNTGGPASRKCG